MSKRKPAAEPVPVINLVDTSSDEEIDAPGCLELAPTQRQDQSTKAARSRSSQKATARAAAGRPAAASKSRVLKSTAAKAPPQKCLRQQLSFTVSQSSLSQPGNTSQPESQQQQLHQACPISPDASGNHRLEPWSCSQAGPGERTGFSRGSSQAPQKAQTQAQPARLPAIHETGQQQADPASEALWADKHAPQSCEELRLAVQQKKVLQVQDWMENQFPDKYRPEYCRLMIVTGPPGCCKSTLVRVLAKQIGFDIVEWEAPAPTLWTEHKYNQPSYGAPVLYSSKLDDFEMFVSRAKYPALALSKTGSSGAQPRCSSRPKLTLLDDLPHASDPDARRRLTAALRDLVTTSRSPVVLVTTESSSNQSSGAGSNGVSGSAKGLHKHLLADLQSIGAVVTTLNPVTVPNMIKVLQHIADKEQIQLSVAAASSIASVADGDLRNAVQTLQMLYGRHGGSAAAGAAQRCAPSKRRKGAASKQPSASRAKALGSKGLEPDELVSIAQVQRDQGLQLFHALGKILYNKRDLQDDDGAGVWDADGNELDGASQFHGCGSRRAKSAAALAREELATQVQQQRRRADAPAAWLSALACVAASVQLPAGRRRPPMRYDPEDLLQRSGLDAGAAAAFLHENYASFFADDAMDNAAAAAEYLSDAAVLTGLGSSAQASFNYSGLEDTPGSSVLDACAGSIATRGLLFVNTLPAPRRFLSMRAPAAMQVRRAVDANAAGLQGFARRLAALQGAAPAGGAAQALAAHVLPYLRKLLGPPSYAWLSRVMPSEWSYLWEGKVSVVQLGSAADRRRVQPEPQELSVFVEGMSLEGAAADGGPSEVEEEDPIEDGA